MANGNFDLSKYDTVNSRIKRFHGDHEDGRIVSEILTPVLDLATVVIKTSVYFSSGDHAAGLPKGTGIASEVFGVGSAANRGSHIENCETSAIGRALANCGYSGTIERASREEMEKAQRWTVPEGDQPKDQKLSQPGSPATQRQQRADQARADNRAGREDAPADRPAPPADPYAGKEADVPANANLACNQCGKALTQGQYGVSLTQFGVPLCPVHQQETKRAGSG